MPGRPPVNDGYGYIGAESGVFPKNAWGIGEMHGNVAEWVLDWLAAYPPGGVADPRGPEDADAPAVPHQSWGEAGKPITKQGPPERVVRGGSYDSSHLDVRSAARSGLTPETRSEFVGFRLVVPIPPR